MDGDRLPRYQREFGAEPLSRSTRGATADELRHLERDNCGGVACLCAHPAGYTVDSKLDETRHVATKARELARRDAEVP